MTLSSPGDHPSGQSPAVRPAADIRPAATRPVRALASTSAALLGTAAGLLRAATSGDELVGDHFADLRRGWRGPDQRGLRHRRAEQGQEGPGWARAGDRRTGPFRAVG